MTAPLPAATQAWAAYRPFEPMKEVLPHQQVGRMLKHAFLSGYLAASGMSAGTAETQSGSGLQPASPTAESGDAPNGSERLSQ